MWKFLRKYIDWILIGVGGVAMARMFLRPDTYISNILLFVTGIAGFCYLSYAAYLWLIKRVDFDWHLINGHFLRKVCCSILLMPFIFTGISMIFIDSPKEMAYEEQLYECSDNGLPCEIKHKQKSPNLFWSTYYHFIDPGNQHMTTTQSGRIWSALIAILGVFLLNGLLVSSIVGWVDRRKEKWLNGEIRYKVAHLGKNKYAIVIGANEIAASAIRNLLSPKKKGELNFLSEGENEYIILQTSRDPQIVRDELSSKLTDEELEKIIIYKALRDSKKELSNLNIEYASEIYVLGETSIIDGGESYHDAMNMRCVNLMAEILDDVETKKQPVDIQNPFLLSSTLLYEYARFIRRAIHQNTTIHRKVCKVLFEYQTTYSIFLFSDVKEAINKYLVFIPFNRYDSWARRVIADGSYVYNDAKKIISRKNCYLPLDGNGIKKDSDDHVHFIVVGMSKMGIAMGVQSLLQAHYINYAVAEKEKDIEKMDMRRTRLTFIDSNADKEKNFFIGRYQNLFNIVRQRYIDTTNGEGNIIEWDDPIVKECCEWSHLNTTKDGKTINSNFLDVEIEFIKGELESKGVREYLSDISNNKNKWVEKSKLTVAICLTQTHQAVAASLYMPISVYEKAQQIWVYQPEADDIILNLKDTKQLDKRYKKLRPFGMVDGEYMSNRSLYLKSILVNAMYDLKKDSYFIGFDVKKIDMGVKDKYKEIREMWKKLTIDKKFSNKYFVDSIQQKIRSVIEEPFTLEEIDNAINSEINKEYLARCEHNRWNVQQLLLGYSPCPKQVDLTFQVLEKERNTPEAKLKRKKWRDDSAQNEFQCNWEELSPLQQQEITKEGSQYKEKYYNIPHGIFDKTKEYYKTGENRIHANICSYDHLDVVDSGAKDYDETLNSKISMFIDKVDLYTSSELNSND